ncbi:MAG: GIY-YIG nuclease family protein [Chloracidobacterium sp.]|nr:GIY-YIG nuclease family protein [Chloracidobacterium sp.]
MPLVSKVNFNSPVYNPQWVEIVRPTKKKKRIYIKSQTKKTPRRPGVYQILCLITGQIYIGSSVKMHERWVDHRRNLRRGPHVNKHLQQAWIRYGEENFEFTVVEYVIRPFLLRAEQLWIDKTHCADRNIGFNICPFVVSPGDISAQVWEGFIDPFGNEITIFNLQEFCRQHGLGFTSMHRLAKGKSKLKSYKGWTRKNSVRQRDYVKTYDDGNPVGLITNLAAFCRERGLEKTPMVAVAHGRICSHHGWTHKDGRQRSEPKAHTGFINPDGQRMTIINLQAFCREHGLQYVHMHQLKNGQRKSHKGWTWRGDGD